MQLIAFPKRTLDELENSLISRNQRLSVEEYEFLTELREFDIRQGWKAYCLNNCAEWLNLRCGITVATGREKVRVANALFGLPLISEAFSEGKVTYSNVRALTRVATPENEAGLLKFAMKNTVSNVEKHCRELRNGNRELSTVDANQQHARRWLGCCQHEDGSVSVNGELPPEVGALFMKALQVATKELEEEGENVSAETFLATQADALARVAAGFLNGDRKQTATADHYQVVVHVDESALRDEGGKSELPVETVRRLACEASVIEVTEDAAGHPLDVGRKKRTLSTPLKRALLSRDQHCRYPGCCNSRWLQAHHVKHWADGGETTLDNLLLLCSKHHRLLHEGGYRIKKHFSGRYYFETHSGKIVGEPLADFGDSYVREPPPFYAVS